MPALITLPTCETVRGYPTPLPAISSDELLAMTASVNRCSFSINVAIGSHKLLESTGQYNELGRKSLPAGSHAVFLQ